MNVLMSESKKYYAADRLKAEAIISEARTKFGDSIKKHSITKRRKVTKEEYIEFYIVDITIEHYEVKDLAY